VGSLAAYKTCLTHALSPLPDGFSRFGPFQLDEPGQSYAKSPFCYLIRPYQNRQLNVSGVAKRLRQGGPDRCVLRLPFVKTPNVNPLLHGYITNQIIVNCWWPVKLYFPIGYIVYTALLGMGSRGIFMLLTLHGQGMTSNSHSRSGSLQGERIA
jgi:hypothetical protein